MIQSLRISAARAERHRSASLALGYDTGMKRRTLERYWSDARVKVDREGRCRLCPEVYGLQFAHTIARTHDERVELEDGSIAIYVDPDDGVPLCPQCHADYDARRVSVLEVLTHDEQAAAVAHVGIVRAMHRLTGQRDVPVALPLPARIRA